MEDNTVNVRNKNKWDSENIEFSTINTESKNIDSKISISTVLDIKDVDLDEYRKLSNMLLAVMNTKDAKMSDSTINIKHYQKEKNLKVMLWGDIEFTKEMLDFISTLTDNRNI